MHTYNTHRMVHSHTEVCRMTNAALTAVTHITKYSTSTQYTCTQVLQVLVPGIQYILRM